MIRDFHTAGQYLKGVIACKVDGDGIGALRTLSNVDGSIIIERLQTLDEASHQLSYVLLTNTPFNNCETVISVSALGADQSILHWSASFRAYGIPEVEAVEIMVGALRANCLELKVFVENQG